MTVLSQQPQWVGKTTAQCICPRHLSPQEGDGVPLAVLIQQHSASFALQKLSLSYHLLIFLLNVPIPSWHLRLVIDALFVQLSSPLSVS